MAREHDERMQGKGRNEERAQSAKADGRMGEQRRDRSDERSRDSRTDRSKSK